MLFRKPKKAEQRSLADLSNKELEDIFNNSNILDPSVNAMAQEAYSVIESRREQVQELYRLAYSEIESGLCEKAFNHLNESVRLSIQYGSPVSVSVYNLMIVAVEELGFLYRDTEILLQTYDNAIVYYRNFGKIDEADLFEKRKADCLVEIQRIDGLRAKYKFSIDCVDMVRALDHLEGIAASKVIEPVYGSFDSVWMSVYKELEYFQTGDTRNKLNKTTSKGARTWLEKWRFLCKEDVPNVDGD